MPYDSAHVLEPPDYAIPISFAPCDLSSWMHPLLIALGKIASRKKTGYALSVSAHP